MKDIFIADDSAYYIGIRSDLERSRVQGGLMISAFVPIWNVRRRKGDLMSRIYASMLVVLALSSCNSQSQDPVLGIGMTQDEAYHLLHRSAPDTVWLGRNRFNAVEMLGAKGNADLHFDSTQHLDFFTFKASSKDTDIIEKNAVSIFGNPNDERKLYSLVSRFSWQIGNAEYMIWNHSDESTFSGQTSDFNSKPHPDLDATLPMPSYRNLLSLWLGMTRKEVHEILKNKKPDTVIDNKFEQYTDIEILNVHGKGDIDFDFTSEDTLDQFRFITDTSNWKVLKSNALRVLGQPSFDLKNESASLLESIAWNFPNQHYSIFLKDSSANFWANIPPTGIPTNVK